MNAILNSLMNGWAVEITSGSRLCNAAGETIAKYRAGRWFTANNRPLEDSSVRNIVLRGNGYSIAS